jgi:hypothetical protein
VVQLHVSLSLYGKLLHIALKEHLENMVSESVKQNKHFIIYLDAGKSGILTKNYVNIWLQEVFSKDSLVLLGSWTGQMDANSFGDN